MHSLANLNFASSAASAAAAAAADAASLARRLLAPGTWGAGDASWPAASSYDTAALSHKSDGGVNESGVRVVDGDGASSGGGVATRAWNDNDVVAGAGVMSQTVDASVVPDC